MRQALAVFREEEINYSIVLLYKSMGECTDFAERSVSLECHILEVHMGPGRANGFWEMVA